MPVLSSAGFVAAPTTNTSQTVTIGFQPKAILFFSCGTAAASGTYDTRDIKAFGMWDGTNNSCIYGFGDAVTQLAWRKQHLDACIEYGNNSNGDNFERARVSSSSATGFTLTWSGINDAVRRRTGYYALGGNDITNVALRRFPVLEGSGGSGPYDVDFGFQPDFVFTMSSVMPTGTTLKLENQMFCIGCSNGLSDEYSIGTFLFNGIGSGFIPFCHRHDANLAYAIEDDDGLHLASGFVQTWLPTGARFDMNVDMSLTEEPGATTDWFAMAIKGGAWDVRQGSSGIVPGPKVYPVSFDPESLFFFSRGGTSNASPRASIGAASAANMGSQPGMWSGRHEFVNETGRTFNESIPLRFSVEPSTPRQAGSVIAYSSGGGNNMTMSWSSDGTGSPDLNPRVFGYVATRSTTSGPGGGTNLWPIFRSVVFRQSQIGR